MKYLLNNLSVRALITSLLTLFASMLVLGAALGVLALRSNNESTALARAVSSRVILVNDAYKDTTRARSALTRAYTTVRESNDADKAAVAAGAVAAAGKSLEKALNQLEAFAAGPVLTTEEEKLRKPLVVLGRLYLDAIGAAARALAANDPATYVTINTKDITASGSAFSAALEKFQAAATDSANEMDASDANVYRLVLWTVGVGIALGLLLVLAGHRLLSALVVRPLTDAAAHLARVASGDLSCAAPRAGGNEVGRVLEAIGTVQDSLANTVREVRSGSEAVNMAASEIAAGNADLSSRTEQASAALEQTAASMEQITATVANNSESARRASTLADEAAALAAHGGDVVGSVVATMSDINASSGKIADIVSVIDGIAFQTNILALNAAVEAARAGESGRGFAVVAGEVRALAQRSATAAKEIRQLTSESVSKISSGNTVVSSAREAIDKAVGAVRNLATIVGEISSASAEQRDGISQVGHAVTQLEQNTQQNAALVEEATAAAGSLEQQARALTAAVAGFRLA